MRKHNMKKFSNKLSGEEDRIFAHLLKQDGIQAASVESTADEAVVALVKVLVEKNVLTFNEFGQSLNAIVSENKQNKEDGQDGHE